MWLVIGAVYCYINQNATSTTCPVVITKQLFLLWVIYFAVDFNKLHHYVLFVILECECKDYVNNKEDAAKMARLLCLHADIITQYLSHSTPTRYLLTTRKMYGSIPSFCWYAYFIWLGVQALEMDERSGWKNRSQVRGIQLSMLNFYSTHATFWWTWGTRRTSRTGIKSCSINHVLIF